MHEQNKAPSRGKAFLIRIFRVEAGSVVLYHLMTKEDTVIPHFIHHIFVKSDYQVHATIRIHSRVGGGDVESSLHLQATTFSFSLTGELRLLDRFEWGDTQRDLISRRGEPFHSQIDAHQSTLAIQHLVHPYSTQTHSCIIEI